MEHKHDPIQVLLKHLKWMQGGHEQREAGRVFQAPLEQAQVEAQSGQGPGIQLV